MDEKRAGLSVGVLTGVRDISPQDWDACANPAGRPFDLIGYLECLPPDPSPHEVNLRASVGRDEPALAVRCGFRSS